MPTNAYEVALTAGRHLLPIVGAALAARFVAPELCRQDADALFDGDAALQRRMALGVGEFVAAGVDPAAFSTGAALYDGEWWFGTYQMAALGLDQLALQQPEHREEYLALSTSALNRVLDVDVRGFDRARWGEDPVEAIKGNNGHAAYLGYTALALAQHRAADPQGALVPVEQAFIEALVARFNVAEGLLETYPGELYPVDNAAGLGAIGLHDRITGEDHSALLDRYVGLYLNNFIDAETGLLVQATNATGTRRDKPRGSGTFLAVYFLSFGLPELSKELWTAGRRELLGETLGFGMMREYPQGMEGHGDIDSGPVVLGYGVSSTGFALAGARIWGDRDTYTSIYPTAALFGGPYDQGETRHFVSGGPLGDAILLAMLTATPAAK